MRGNTVTLHLAKGSIARTGGLFQYDYGQRLILDGVELPFAYEVHFSNKEHGESKTSIGDNTGVDIPDEYLQTGENIHVWLYMHEGEDDGETEYHGIIAVQKRAQPTSAEPTPVQQDVITQTIAALNEAVEGVPETIDTALQEAKDSGEFDGFSPTANVTKEGHVATITITDKEGTTTATVEDGTAEGIIDDNAGAGVKNRTWSADKINASIVDIHSFDVQIVNVLPTENISTHTIYFVPKEREGNDAYDEYMYIDNAWEFIGTTQVDVSNKADKADTILLTTLSRGRKSGTTVGGNSFAFGQDVTASGNNTHAEGYNTTASGSGTHAEGGNTNAQGQYSHAEGEYTTAYGIRSHAEGYATRANGAYSHAEGSGDVGTGAYGKADHAEGYQTIADSGLAADVYGAHAEGRSTTANGNAAHAEGFSTIANAEAAHAEGKSTKAYGAYSHAEGIYSEAYAAQSHAEGNNSYIGGGAVSSHAEGWNAEVTGLFAHAEGNTNTVTGDAAHAEGFSNTADGDRSHAEGTGTHTAADSSHTEGGATITNGTYSHAEGDSTRTFGNASHAEGCSTQAIGSQSHAEGYSTQSAGHNSHAEGYYSVANGSQAHAEGSNTTADGLASHAEGMGTTGTGAYGNAAHAEGYQTLANSNGDYSYGAHAEGASTIAIGNGAHAEGGGTQATGQGAHAEGSGTQATGQGAHAEGSGARATESWSHAEGGGTQATAQGAHAEGGSTYASAQNAHAEGAGTTAAGYAAHAEGGGSQANGETSHAEGSGCYANGMGSHAEGTGTIANGAYSHVVGRNNIADSYDNWPEWVANTYYEVGARVKRTVTSNGTTTVTGYTCKNSNNDSTFTASKWNTDYQMNYVEIVGIGGTNTRKNARTLDWDGNEWISGSIAHGSGSQATGTYSYAGGTGAIATGSYSHAEGSGSTASAQCTHAEGAGTTASNSWAHAEGGGTSASGTCAHAEGGGSVASGSNAHAEGGGTTASGNNSHSEGASNQATGANSHVEGSNNVSSGANSHAEGNSTTASALQSHAEGSGTTASGFSAHAEGSYTIANHANQHVFGMFNEEDTSSAVASANGTYVEIVGNGASANERSNARTLDWSGNENLAGDLTINKGTANEKTIGTELTQLNGAITKSPSIKNTTETDVDLDVTDPSGNVVVRLEDGHIKTKYFDSEQSVKRSEVEHFTSAKGSSTDPADFAIADVYGNVLLSLRDGGVETKSFRGFTYKTYSSEKISFNGSQTTLTVNHPFHKGDRVVLHVERGGWKPWDYGVRIDYYEGETQIADDWAGDHAYFEHTVMEDVESFSVVYPASSVATGTNLQFQVSLLGDIPIRPTVVTIKKDGSGDFDNLRDCLESIGLKANRVLNPYRIEIYPGTYDTLADYSAEEIAATTYPFDQTSFVGPKLLDGMYLVGMGSPQEVVLTAELDPEEYNWDPVRGSISTLNIQGSGGIENLTIIAHYIRYCVHDDFHHAKSQKAKRIVKNCIFRGYGITYTPGTTYGAGTSPGGCDYEFINCDFGDNVGVHTVANLSTIHCTNCIGHGFRIGDNQEDETDNPPSEYKFDNCDFTWINQRMVDTEPHVIIRGCGGKSPLYQLDSQTLYITGDITVVPNVDKQYAYSGVGTLLEWYCNSEHGPRYKEATSYDTACAIVVAEDSDYTYIQTKGYVRTDRTSITSFNVGDYVGFSSGEAAIVGSESTAIGRITYIDNTGAGYIKLKWKE